MSDETFEIIDSLENELTSLKFAHTMLNEASYGLSPVKHFRYPLRNVLSRLKVQRIIHGIFQGFGKGKDGLLVGFVRFCGRSEIEHGIKR